MAKPRRLSFVFGSNGPSDYGSLRYAVDDARRVTKSLQSSACGFVVEAPPVGSTAKEVRDQLLRFTESCEPGDSVLCYFSGHGILEQGDLFLLWDDTEINRLMTTTIAAADILRAFRFCGARNKLLILDCCHAGGIIDPTGLKGDKEIAIKTTKVRPDNHLVLMASDRFERARETDDLQGSFLTVNLCLALDEMLEEADVDEDGRLSITDLTEWLRERAILHNEGNPAAQVPIPYLFGKQKGGQFFLTQDPASE